MRRANDSGSHNRPSVLDGLSDLPRIRVAVEPEYLDGFPMVVAVTLDNTDDPSNWHGLPAFGLFTGTGPIGAVFISQDGRRLECPPVPPMGMESRTRGRFDLDAGQSRRMLFDLSGLQPALTPGHYQLEITYADGVHRSRAEPVRIHVSVPDDSDREAGKKLLGAAGASSWAMFIVSKAEADTSKLSKEARRALALHLFLRHAIHGDEAIRDLNISALAKDLTGDALAGEAAVLRYEILAAESNMGEAEKAAKKILKKWPGLAWRLEEVNAGRGWLRVMRGAHGSQ